MCDMYVSATRQQIAKLFLRSISCELMGSVVDSVSQIEVLDLVSVIDR
jgi:hypothetical protein